MDKLTGISESTVVIPIGMDCRDPNQRDPMYKAYRGWPLKKIWAALNDHKEGT